MSDIFLPRTKKLRLALGLTQAAMAQRLLVTQSTIDRLEKGQRERPAHAFFLDQMERELACAHNHSSAAPPAEDAPAAVAPPETAAGAPLVDEAAA